MPFSFAAYVPIALTSAPAAALFPVMHSLRENNDPWDGHSSVIIVLIITLPVGYKRICRLGHITPIYFSQFPQSVSRVQGLSLKTDGTLHLLDPASVAVTAAFESPVSELVVQMQRESSKIACLIAKTTN